MRRLAAGFLLLLLSYSAGAQFSEIGINPLRLEIGARPLGMGAGFAGLADDVNTALYNPAGLAWVKGVSLTMKDIENFTALQAYPTGFNSALGLAVIGSKLTDVPMPNSTNVANSNSKIVLMTYGTKLNFLPGVFKNEIFQRLGFGASVKGLMSQTLRRTGQTDRSANGWNMDLGVLWKGNEWSSVGFSAQNILPTQIKFDVGTEEGIPAIFKLGASARVIGDLGVPIFMEGRELTLGGELNYFNSSLILRAGGEWGIDRTYFLRTGIMQQWKPGAVVSNLNFGLGYRSETWGADMVSCREPLRDEGQIYFSFLYFPKDWIVLKKLDVEKPSVFLEEPFEKISLTDNVITYDDKIEVFGKVKPGVEVYVNDLRAATGEDHTFKVVVPLQLEKNLIAVEARYEGEKKFWKYKVLRRAKVLLTGAKTGELAARRKEVEELVTMGVIEVTPEAEFRLDASITRGELATWLAKSAGLRLSKIERDVFADVNKDHPQAGYIKAVTDWNIMLPFPDGTFRPGQPVTKEEGDKLFSILKKAQQ